VVLSITDAKILGDEVADELRDQLLAVVVQSGCHTVILDFSAVTFLSSSGFRPLLSLHRLLRQHEGKLLLCGLREDVREIFEVTRLITTKPSVKAPFEVHDTVPEAVASLYA
jgi:anti-anti-sigma factor